VNGQIPATLPTMKGGFFSLDDPFSHQFDIEEIAHALSNICRFNGHVRKNYSVAQHSFLCSMVNTHECPYEKLMHDCSEAYIGDVTSPLKRMLPTYLDLEMKIELALCKFFDLPIAVKIGKFSNGLPFGEVPNLPPQVKETDLSVLAAERIQLLNGNDVQYANCWNWIDERGIKPADIKIKPWSHTKAKHMFLARFYELCPEKFLAGKPESRAALSRKHLVIAALSFF